MKLFLQTINFKLKKRYLSDLLYMYITLLNCYFNLKNFQLYI